MMKNKFFFMQTDGTVSGNNRRKPADQARSTDGQKVNAGRNQVQYIFLIGTIRKYRICSVTDVDSAELLGTTGETHE
jgi:hypothetical protein